MELTFLYLSEFVREWDRQKLTDLDLRALEETIATGVHVVPVIRPVFSKNDTANFSAAERAAIATRLKHVERSFR